MDKYCAYQSRFLGLFVLPAFGMHSMENPDLVGNVPVYKV